MATRGCVFQDYTFDDTHFSTAALLHLLTTFNNAAKIFVVAEGEGIDQMQIKGQPGKMN